MTMHGMLQAKEGRIAELEADLEGAKALIVKASVGETFERNMAQREWLEHQSERRMWRRLFFALWLFTTAVFAYAGYVSA